mmetsp:Transcript_7677/g.23953  ORF Transcript_7677/g.23953 Transcript_7677/m.23953 type:complete len:306 (-) Transcript_7677:63-980(-)
MVTLAWLASTAAEAFACDRATLAAPGLRCSDGRRGDDKPPLAPPCCGCSWVRGARADVAESTKMASSASKCSRCCKSRRSAFASSSRCTAACSARPCSASSARTALLSDSAPLTKSRVTPSHCASEAGASRLRYSMRRKRSLSGFATASSLSRAALRERSTSVSSAVTSPWRRRTARISRSIFSTRRRASSSVAAAHTTTSLRCDLRATTAASRSFCEPATRPPASSTSCRISSTHFSLFAPIPGRFGNCVATASRGGGIGTFCDSASARFVAASDRADDVDAPLGEATPPAIFVSVVFDSEGKR